MPAPASMAARMATVSSTASPFAPNHLTDTGASTSRFHRPVTGFDAGTMTVPPLSGSVAEASQ